MKSAAGGNHSRNGSNIRGGSKNNNDNTDSLRPNGLYVNTKNNGVPPAPKG
jgi:hypothetical protein